MIKRSYAEQTTPASTAVTTPTAPATAETVAPGIADATPPPVEPTLLPNDAKPPASPPTGRNAFGADVGRFWLPGGVLIDAKIDGSIEITMSPSRPEDATQAAAYTTDVGEDVLMVLAPKHKPKTTAQDEPPPPDQQPDAQNNGQTPVPEQEQEA